MFHITLKNAALKNKFPAVNDDIIKYASHALAALKKIDKKQTPTQLEGFLTRQMSQIAANSDICPRVSGEVIEFVQGLCIVLERNPAKTWTPKQASAFLIAALESEQELSA